MGRNNGVLILGLLGLGYLMLKPSPGALKNGAALVTFTAGTGPYGTPAVPWVPKSQYKEQVQTSQALASILEGQQRALVKRSGLTRAQITASERLVYEARQKGLTDF